jgi:hypothetical protein
MGELLTWENLSNMNYTGEVALKTLRMFPLLFGGSGKLLKIQSVADTLFLKGGK